MRVRDLFQNVYVINLDEDVERWQRLRAQFRDHGLPAPRRFSAIRGATVDEARKRQIRARRKIKTSFASDGHLGCALSHLALWKQALEGALSHVTILEDDVTLSPALGALLDVELPQDWDLLYLGHVKGAAYLKNARAMASQPPYGANLHGENFHAFAAGDDGPLCGYAYAFVPQRLRSFIEEYDFQRNSDSHLATMHGRRRTYGLYPSLFVHSYEHGSHTSPLNVTDSLRWWVSYLTNPHRHLLFGLAWLVALAGILYFTRSRLWAVVWMLVFIVRMVRDFSTLREKLNTASAKGYVNLPGFFGVHYFDPLGNVWDDASKEQALALLRRVHEVCTCKEREVRYFVAFGTLLGWARHEKKLVPWDDDLDIAVDRRDLPRLLTGLRSCADLRLVKKWSIGCGIFYKVYSASSDGIWPFIDIFPYDLAAGGTRITWSFLHYAKTLCLPSPLLLVSSVFEGLQVVVPAQWQAVLDTEYGTSWRERCRSSTYCHRYEEEIDGRYALTLASKYLGLASSLKSPSEVKVKSKSSHSQVKVKSK